ncbi:hypothetical protein RHSIM_Rhsim02G0092600 [Rhododendron simsii]|uniref:Pentatricopeptide repeat-containing protein n=1 Tax=Rhododendron simsii TaxID=118357 RepID=A0A834H8I2_RHOSS|nr:hypothetical protein RHSIM_Rhsim02G0092600 [Rhododendron simsii]
MIVTCSTNRQSSMGKMVHEFIESGRFKIDLKLGTALVDMYAKCGDIDNSHAVFNAMNKKDMLLGFRMILEQTMPDSITFICVLSAFSPIGLADTGLNYFNVMNDVYGIIEPHVDGTLFANNYSQVMKWDKVLKVRRMMKRPDMIPGISSVEVDNALHLFISGDT